SRSRHTIFSRDWSSDVCSSELFLDGENLTRVESWATFLIELGWRVGDLNQENQPLVTVLILPTRRYAAAFFITGLVARRAAERRSEDRRVGKEWHGWCAGSTPE